jgi:hypothetical protein
MAGVRVRVPTSESPAIHKLGCRFRVRLLPRLILPDHRDLPIDVACLSNEEQDGQRARCAGAINRPKIAAGLDRAAIAENKRCQRNRTCVYVAGTRILVQRLVRREKTRMECSIKDDLEQHLSDIRRLGARRDLTSEERNAAARAEKFAIALLKEHNATGHNGKACPYATRLF